MENSSPPLSPIRQYIDTSPSHSQYREHLRRRTSSFSSNNHDRSPTSPQSRHRFSTASQLSVEVPDTPLDERGGGGLGNLADELDQLDDEDDEDEDDDDDFDEGVTDDIHHQLKGEEQSRDSGIDVSYANSEKGGQGTTKRHVRNFSKPFGGGSDSEKPPDEIRSANNKAAAAADAEDDFSSDLEDMMNTIARMTSYTSNTEDPLVPRTVTQLQDLGNQTDLEAGAHRLVTSTNSLTSHLTSQAKALQTLAQSLYPMYAGFGTTSLDPSQIEEVLPLLDMLKDSLPHPDMMTVQKLQKLDRETLDVIQTLSTLTDTLQMGKQITNSAARHLRTTQTMVEELRRERERGESAKEDLTGSGWDAKLEKRWCGAQCGDILSGFEKRCDVLRGELMMDERMIHPVMR